MEDWQQQVRDSFTQLQQLLTAGLLDAPSLMALSQVVEPGSFPLRISRYYANLIDKGDPNCPIRLQTIPQPAEWQATILPCWLQGWCQKTWGVSQPWRVDPIGDMIRLAVNRLTHRYRHRVLLHSTGVCGVHCRFCFRKENLSSSEPALYRGEWQPALQYIAQRPWIREVILSGGDPLMLTDAKLADLLTRLSGIRHVRHIRLHTRMVVALPARITQALCMRLRNLDCVVALVNHFNHPKELTFQSLQALRRLRRSGVVLYNQCVLMRRVNDDVTTLARLLQRLYEQGVRPFYLHHMDYVPGSLHLRVPLHRGLKLVAKLAGKLSGPAMPEYVLDLPQGWGKVRLKAGLQPLVYRRNHAIGAAVYRLRAPATLASPHGGFRHYVDIWQV